MKSTNFFEMVENRKNIGVLLEDDSFLTRKYGDSSENLKIDQCLTLESPRKTSGYPDSFYSIEDHEVKKYQHLKK